MRAFGSVANDHSGPTLRLLLDVSVAGDTYIDATTGEIIRQSYIDESTGATLPLERVPHPEVEAVVATIAVCPFDPTAAPWPYTSNPPALLPETHGMLRYLEPNPAASIQVLASQICNDPGGLQRLSRRIQRPVQDGTGRGNRRHYVG